MKKYKFIDNNGTFSMKQPENYSYLYFPIARQNGLKSSLTPNMGGDSKLDQNSFVLEPVSSENLHNNRSSRNFWCRLSNGDAWSATGQSAEAEYDKFTERQDESELTAGLMWHETRRASKKYNLSSKVTAFVPLDDDVEIMNVQITNTGNSDVEIDPIAAVPLYGRSADNIRDHRHVTSLLHRIRTTEDGVYVRPTLSFDERGHQKNNLTYYVCGSAGDGSKPVLFYPTTDMFIGEGGTYTRPRAVVEDFKGAVAGEKFEGFEAVGAVRFEKITVKAGETVSYNVFIGVTADEASIAGVVKKYSTTENVMSELNRVRNYWNDQVNVVYHTGDSDFDNYMRWVSFQPFLRRIYGCSFLPHHDYGKGGRGWRDLWQDCLALLMMNPSGVRQMILDNFQGVRIDGTNATIIGEKQGEFVADRNGITRVWMDHGMWPFMTTKLYIDQSGDIDVLNQEVIYFKDAQVERGMAMDEEWDAASGNIQMGKNGNVYKGTVLEHLILQHICSFYEVGKHNYLRLRGADWNDALDMADENGESVAFTCAYAGNIKQIAEYVRLLKEKTGQDKVELLSEIIALLDTDADVYSSIDKKVEVLVKYGKECRHTVAGDKKAVDIEWLASKLEEKANWMSENIQKNEWVTDGEGNGWFNSYYDNHCNAVEGVFSNEVRMILTGQVFAVMSKTATKDQMKSICESARKYLYDASVGGYRINTNFHEEKYDFGRMFGFAYGEKENGAVFSHMTVMYANALYQNGFVKEGHEALQTLADTALNFEISKIYPGIPEYFNAKGRGMYHYLTGAASWYMLTVITEVFGVRGDMNSLVLEPKLVKEQFDKDGNAGIKLVFAEKEIEVRYNNASGKDYGEYSIESAAIDGNTALTVEGKKAYLDRSIISGLADGIHVIDVELK